MTESIKVVCTKRESIKIAFSITKFYYISLIISLIEMLLIYLNLQTDDPWPKRKKAAMHGAVIRLFDKKSTPYVAAATLLYPRFKSIDFTGAEKDAVRV